MKHNNTKQQQSWIVVRVKHDGTKSVVAEYGNKENAVQHAQALRQLIGGRYQAIERN